MRKINSQIFKTRGQIACRNCSINGEPKPKGTIMISENGYFFCWNCYLALAN